MKSIFRRLWLNPSDKDLAAHILWNIEPRKQLHDTDIVFKIADCYRTVSLDFSAYTKEQRQRSLAKAKILLREITDFHNALENLCQKIDS